MQRNSEDVAEFLTEAKIYLDRSEPLLASMRESGAATPNPEVIASLFRAFHSIKGVAGFLQFTVIQEVTHKAEEAMDRVRSGRREFDASLGNILLETCDFLRLCFDAISTRNTDDIQPELQASLVARLKTFSESHTHERNSTHQKNDSQGWLFEWLFEGDLRPRFLSGIGKVINDIDAALIGILDAPTQLGGLAEAAVFVDRIGQHAHAFGFQHAVKLCESFAQVLRRPRLPGSGFDPSEMSVLFAASNALKGILSEQGMSQAAEGQAKSALRDLDALPAPNQTTPAHAVHSETPKTAVADVAVKTEIRVALDKMDRMVELVEELGVVSTGVVQTVEEMAQDNGLRQSAIKMRQITEELQEINVSIRMVPLSTVFRKMIRLVGDVSAKLGKKARLEILGDQTELDRDAAEALQDPLVHMIRNCVDHGLELPDERLAAGKAETGKILLQAWHSGGEVWIRIADDGRGIDWSRLVAKAIEKGLVPSSYSPDDPEALQLIFHPGFSLASQVTEFSGRGVGMDVVKKNIEGLKGRVEIESSQGKGTTFTIRLPTANALTESMLVRVGNLKYILRVASIRETFRPDENAIVRLPNGEELVKLRGMLYPMVRLHQIHRIDNAVTQVDKGLIVMVENRGRQVGIFVDEVLAKIQAVIKPTPTLLKASTSIAGCSIIGTGSDSVAIALDVNALESAGKKRLETLENTWQPC